MRIKVNYDYLIGVKKDRLTVISTFRGHTTKYNLSVGILVCICDCGNTREIVAGAFLTKNRRLSCGCYRFSTIYKDGRTQNPLYTLYHNLKNRCYNEKNDYYGNYGGRGITVCDRWLESFSNFVEDMGPRPGKNYSIDRIDNSLGYSPENCRWATPEQQARNKRNNIVLEINGERIVGLSAISKLIKVRISAFYNLKNKHLSVEEFYNKYKL